MVPVRCDWATMRPVDEHDGTDETWVSIGYAFWYKGFMATDGWVWEWYNNWVTWRQP